MLNTSTTGNDRMKLPPPFTAFPENLQHVQNNNQNFENTELQ